MGRLHVSVARELAALVLPELQASNSKRQGLVLRKYSRKQKRH